MTHPSSPCHVHRRPLAFFLIKPKQQPLPPPQQLPFPFPSLSSSFFSLIARTNEKDPRVQAQTPGLNPFPVHPPAKPVAFRVPPGHPVNIQNHPHIEPHQLPQDQGQVPLLLIPGSGLLSVGDNPVPKGQMAVYVGQKDGVFQRVLVPVISTTRCLEIFLEKRRRNTDLPTRVGSLFLVGSRSSRGSRPGLQPVTVHGGC